MRTHHMAAPAGRSRAPTYSRQHMSCQEFALRARYGGSRFQKLGIDFATVGIHCDCTDPEDTMMSNTAQLVLRPRHILYTLYVYRMRWIVPTLAILLIGTAYALLHSRTWEAKQALVIREEALGDSLRPGRFDGTDAMRTAQETVQQLATSDAVITAALREAGPGPGDSGGAEWPQPAAVKDTSDAVSVIAPKGIEFGRTEVFYLKVRHRDRARAVALANAVCNQLDQRLRELRDSKATSLVNELNQNVKLAEGDLAASTARLVRVEQAAGEDLAELRLLNEAIAGESNLRQSMIQIRNELRQASLSQRMNEQLLHVLAAAKQDPANFVAIPNELLQAHPALQQLKNGLITSQLRTASLRGEMTDAHPQVQAAIAAEQVIRDSLHSEIDTALRSITAELQLNHIRVQASETQLASIGERMNRVGGIRAEYSNLASAVKQNVQTLEKARDELAQARANAAAANAVSLITRLDAPTTGDRPLGPGRATIALGSLFGGLLTGVGVVFLTVPATGADGLLSDVTDSSEQPNAAEINLQRLLNGVSLRQALATLHPMFASRN